MSKKIEEIKESIQDWFGTSIDAKEVCDIYVAILTEAEKQYGFVLEDLLKVGTKEEQNTKSDRTPSHWC